MHSSHHAWIRLSYTSVVPSLLGKVCVQRVNMPLSSGFIRHIQPSCRREQDLLYQVASLRTSKQLNGWQIMAVKINIAEHAIELTRLSISLSLSLSIYPSIYLSNYPSSYLYTSLKDRSQVSLSLSLLRKDAPDQQVSRASVNESLDATSSATIPLALLLHNKKRSNILNCVTMWAMLVKSPRLTVLGSTLKTREPRYAQ